MRTRTEGARFEEDMMPTGDAVVSDGLEILKSCNGRSMLATAPKGFYLGLLDRTMVRRRYRRAQD